MTADPPCLSRNARNTSNARSPDGWERRCVSDAATLSACIKH
ncbi:hypothetical protein OHAE_224 [Ochrobactrum soli]|uniref:Uncharacterized protein n=1 Tax=Ochrobactrum soli TaxID=2448455 RepID=A0A2P9HJT7_9HYPH|nr:hypothetical protein OHAE_224 [[Ochrobactrum] soli]